MTAAHESSSTRRLFGGKRLATLLGSLVVALCSGTNYVFSAYAPQLGSRLGITHTQLNIVALAGNVGVYSTGPPFGWVVDRKGPKPLLVGAFFSLFIGYFGMRHFYISVEDDDTASLLVRQDSTSAARISTLAFCVLVLCSYLSGAGGSAGLCSSINSTAKTFPDRVRGSVTGLVISGFGLSAFFFSAIAHLLFPGDVAGLLLLLALGTSIPMVGAYFIVRPIPLSDTPYQPLPTARDGSDIENLDSRQDRPRRTSFADLPHDGFAHLAGVDAVLSDDVLVYEHVDDSHTQLVNPRQVYDIQEESVFEQEDYGGNEELSRSVELSRSPPRGQSVGHHRRRSSSARSKGKGHAKVIEVMEEIHGRALAKSMDFWMLTIMLSLLSGTGLMYINNVGSISQALFAQGNPDFDAVEASKWQALQVSIISVANCLGRIFVGLGADLMKNQAGAPRSYCICIVSAVFILSQVFATQVNNIEHLWMTSALLGLGYGGTFGLFPTIVIEWFGLRHFSENWGYVSMAPMVGGNLFSLAFGRNLDKHAAHKPDTPHGALLRRAGLPSTEQCFEGRDCYVSSLYLTIFACSLSLAISIFAARRDKKRMIVTEVPPEDEDAEVLWEGRE